MKKPLLISILFIFLFVSSDAIAGSRIFGKKGKRESNIEMFHKWTGVLSKISGEMKNYSKRCKKNSKKFYCNITEWKAFLDSIKDKSKSQKLKLVNEFANEKKYVIDQVNWGIEDYWASVGEFLFKNGDCEDYAIIKYISLIELGFSKNDLKLVILNDENLGVIHAVLAVDKGFSTYILDNQISKVTKQNRIFHYTPIFSINEKYWWKYI